MKGTAKGCEMVRVTVEDAKRLIREASQMEAFVSVYVSPDGGIEARREECRAPYLEADFPGLLQSLGIVPHHKWRPHITQYAGGNDYDDLQYTVTRDEAQRVAEAFGVSLDATPTPSASAPAVAAPEPVATPAEAVPSPGAGGKETPVQRRERLEQRVSHWKAKGVRNFTAIVAEEEGVTEARIRQILSKAKPKKPTGGKKAKPRQPATFCSGLMTPN